MMERLEYMFDIYNINISEPFITYNELSFDILKYKEFPDNYTIIQHEGCNLYFHEDKLIEYGPDRIIINEKLELFVFLDKKVPVFKTARSAYNFLIGLDKCLWKDDTKKVDFRWCEFHDIDNVYIDDEIIKTFSFINSYVNGSGTDIYRSVLHLVPEEFAKLLEKNRNLLQLADVLLKTKDIKNIIKMTEQ